ncbi:MAG: serine/threonine protein kinase, partial [Cytophagaceae bacterium]|nr:serine/threonine protein kinase [Gemmatimonadaceae bacterium]
MAKTCPVCSTTYDDASAFCPADGSTLIATENAGDLVGSVIADRYLVSSLLGEGGMGRVYLARHVRLPQQAAIKVLHPGMLSDPEAVARFNREAANAARIEHDRVARVFDFGETREGSVYLAMEYVPGKTLRSILEAEQRLHMARAANLVYQVAEGLDAAHRINIVHRDLKPDNIMVVTDDQGVDRAKVVDFGIAKAADAGGQTRLTRTGTVVGTPEYMSPEQVLGESIDARSDVYALALVAYNMFTGVLPFTGSTPERMFTARLIE